MRAPASPTTLSRLADDPAKGRSIRNTRIAIHRAIHSGASMKASAQMLDIILFKD